MKILVSSHHLEDFYFTPHRMAWLGVKALVDRLLELGIQADFFDLCPPESSVTTKTFPSWLSHLLPFLIPGETGPFSFFSTYKKKSLPIESLINKIQQFRPDALLISNFAYAYADTVLETVSNIKAKYPSLPIMVGGHGPSCHPEFFLQNGYIDQVFCGPAEVLTEIHLSHSGIQKLSPEQTSRVIPSLSVTKHDTSRIIVSGSFSRGCAHKCNFCANYLAHGRKFLTAELSLIEKKVAALPDAPSCHLNFEDDNLLLKKDFVDSIISIFQKKYSRFTFSFENGIDYRLLDEQTLQHLHLSGLTALNLTLATISQSSLDRDTNPARFSEVCILANRLNLPCITYVIGGLPGTTPEDLTSDLIFLSKLPVTIGLSPFYPVPGTANFQIDNKDIKTTPGLCRSSSLFPWTPGFTTSDLITAFRLSRTLNARHARLGVDHTELLQKILREKTLFTTTKSQSFPILGLNQGMTSAVLDSLHPA